MSQQEQTQKQTGVSDTQGWSQIKMAVHKKAIVKLVKFASHQRMLTLGCFLSRCTKNLFDCKQVVYPICFVPPLFTP